MVKNKKTLAGKHKRVALLQPMQWLLFWWLVFTHAPAWVPNWMPISVYTIFAFIGVIVVIDWFNFEEVELEFLRDGRVTWKVTE